jgi:hypothetical protein
MNEIKDKYESLNLLIDEIIYKINKYKIELDYKTTNNNNINYNYNNNNNKCNYCNNKGLYIIDDKILCWNHSI